MSTAYPSTARASDRRGESRRLGAAAMPLRIAGLCAAGMALTWLVAALVPAARFKDAVAAHDFTLLSGSHVDTVSHDLLGLLEPGIFTALGVVLVIIALVRRRPAVALAVVAVMGLAPLTAELLKPLLAHAHDQVGATYVADASWPSGHATAAGALVLCALLVLPARLRPPVAALGALFAAAVGCSLLILAWHLPSDIVGGYLVAALWTSLAVAGLRAHAAHTARLRSQRLGADRRSAGVGVVGGAGTPAADGRAGPVGAGVP